MNTYAIDEWIGLLSFKTVHLTGKVSVQDEIALELKVAPKVPLDLEPAQTYHVKVSPKSPLDSDTKTWTLVKIPIKVQLELKTDKCIVLASIRDGTNNEIWSYIYPYGAIHGVQPIEAYGIYAFIEALDGWADHTYAIAKSAGGAELIWRCGGNFDKGHTLGKGRGNVDLCDCLSQRTSEMEKELGGLAGIRYAIDGVCHQAANRILLPAGMEVSRANAYRVSHALYGRLGLEAVDGEGRTIWERITKKCGVPMTVAMPVSQADRDTLSTECARSFVLAHAPETPDDAMATVMASRASAVALKNDLSRALLDGSVRIRDFTMQMNQAAKAYVVAAKSAISPPAFKAMFANEEKEWLLINPEIMERVYAKGVPAGYRPS